MAADPNSVESHYLVGVLHRRRGETPEAIAAFNDVLKLNPLVASAQVQLAELTLAAGQGDLAVAHSRDAVQQFPRDPAVRLALIHSLMETGQDRLAEEALDLYTREFPQSAAGFAALGTLRLKTGALPAARVGLRARHDDRRGAGGSAHWSGGARSVRAPAGPRARPRRHAAGCASERCAADDPRGASRRDHRRHAAMPDASRICHCCRPHAAAGVQPAWRGVRQAGPAGRGPGTLRGARQPAAGRDRASDGRGHPLRDAEQPDGSPPPVRSASSRSIRQRRLPRTTWRSSTQRMAGISRSRCSSPSRPAENCRTLQRSPTPWAGST